MEYKKHKQVKIIHARDAGEFEIKLNKVLAVYPNAEIHYNDNLGFCAYVTFEYEERIPEDVREEFHEKGVFYKCRNCPEMKPPKDGRFKWCECDRAPRGRVYMNSDACEWFYRSLLKGEIKREQLNRF